MFTLIRTGSLILRMSPFWVHPALIDRITISGSDGDDAQSYQEAEVQNVLRKLRKVQDE